MDSGTIVTVLTVAAGGLELRWSVHKALRRLREHHVRLAALEDGRKPPSLSTGSDPFGDTPAMQHPAQRFHRLGLIALIVGVFAFSLTGCNEAQIDRAQALADASDAKLAAATQSLAIAKQALAEARAVAEKVGTDQARQLVAQAEAAVDAGGASVDVAKKAAEGAHAAVDAAKTAQAAGASTFNVLAAAATALVPTAGGLLVAIANAAKAWRAVRQTVAGVDAAKAKLPDDAIATLHAELAKTQDESTKAAVDLVQAKAAAAAGG